MHTGNEFIVSPKDFVGKSVGFVTLIEKSTAGLAKNGKPFASYVFRDNEYTLEGKEWDCATPHAANSVVFVEGKMEEFAGKAQINVTFIEANNTLRPEQFYRGTPFDVEKLWADLVELVHSFKEPLTAYVAEDILCDSNLIERIKKSPAATGVHNNWFGGLLEHIWSLCTIAEPLIAHYKKHYAPQLSRDKVLFGLMMHDLGKVVEYNSANPAFPKTGNGILANHMVLAPAWIYHSAQRFAQKHDIYGVVGSPEEFESMTYELMHLVAAHHGRIDWGSPVVPATLEAVLVHHLDNLDSKMLHAWDLIANTTGDIPGFSAWSKYERTPFLKPKVPDESQGTPAAPPNALF